MAPRPRVIAISGGGGDVERTVTLHQAMSAADAFLEKPLERGDLLATVDRVLAKPT